jgi:galactokinase
VNVGRLLENWRRRFPGAPTVIGSAPGRVNLIGEHTDYNLGYVLPAAIAERTYVLARRSSRSESFVISTDKRTPATFRLRDEKKSLGWPAYVKAVGYALCELIGSEPPEIEALIASTLPRGAGLSSSAALEVSLAATWARLAGAELSPREVAEIAWRAEHDFVGVPCGKMDQYASALGQDGCALLIDTATMETRPIPLPDDLTIAVLDTRVRRTLASGEYARRVEECARAVRLLQEAGRQVQSLRDATSADLGLLERTGDEVAFRRARHVVLENLRVLAFVDALEGRDTCALGRLMAESHASLRDDYEVSSPELDAMVRAASCAPGCVGVRMTGAGFGGCCVALVEAGRMDEFLPATLQTYRAYGFPEPSVRLTTPSHGVDVIEVTKPSTEM